MNNKTQIEWVRNPDGSQGYTWNPITGCLNHDNGLCKGGGFPCYAYKLAHTRLKQRYLANSNWCHWNPPENGYYDPFYPRFWEERLAELQRGIDDLDYQRYIHQKPKGIFVCDMGDLFGISVPEEWTRKVLETIDDDSNSMHRFYLLTKQPQNLINWSPFPENCYVGVTATNRKMFCEAIRDLKEVKATVKYISIEPCLERVISNDGWICEGANNVPLDDAFMMKLARISWLIIGACTGTVKEVSHLCDKYLELTPMQEGKKWTAQPPIEWLQEIVATADKAGIKVFLKENLMPLFKRGDIWAIPEWAGFNDWSKQEIGTTLRQEMPKGEK